MSSKSKHRKAKLKQLTKFLNQSKAELRKYNKTKKLIHLQQAGEKAWNAYIYLLEALSGLEIRNHRDISKVAKILAVSKNDDDFIELGKETEFLHSFFYEGVGTDFFVKRSLRRAYKLFSRIRRRYRLY